MLKESALCFEMPCCMQAKWLIAHNVENTFKQQFCIIHLPNFCLPLHSFAQAKEDDGHDPQRVWAHRRGESLPHRSYSYGNEGEVCSWEPAGQDVRDTVSFFFFLFLLPLFLIPPNTCTFKWSNQDDVLETLAVFFVLHLEVVKCLS